MVTETQRLYHLSLHLETLSELDSTTGSMFSISRLESNDAQFLMLEDAITMLKRKFLLEDPIIIHGLHTEMEEVITWIHNGDKQNTRDEVMDELMR
ncbi:hypothetical protein RYX36_002499 [Vicia faba]